MESPALITLSRQLTLRREMDVIANNIANMNTPSYKGEKMMFVEYLVEPQKDQPLSFVQDFGMIRDMTEGPLASTNNPLDMAISGDGFFTVETENGARYTRSGRFQLDREGQIVNQLGHPLLTAGGQPILVPSGSGPITIASDGTLSAGTQVLGTVGVVTFEKPKEMQREANNLFNAEEQPQAATNSHIMQAMLEESNVSGITEMTKMIEIHRRYTSNQRLMQQEHDRIRRSISKLTGTQNS